MTQQCLRRNNRHHLQDLVVQFSFCVLTVFAGTESAYSQRPPLAPPHRAQVELENLKAAAPNSVSDTDPDMCLASGSSDPGEQSIGGLSSRAVYEFSSQPHLQDLYARLIMVTKVCTNSTLSSQDRGRLQKILNFLKITNARSFAASISQTGDGCSAPLETRQMGPCLK